MHIKNIRFPASVENLVEPQVAVTVLNLAPYKQLVGKG